MDKLIRRSEIRPYKLENIESPFFASSRIEDYLEDELSYHELDADDFEEDHEIGFFYPQSGPQALEAAIESVEDGTWLLVTQKPFSPLSERDNLADYPHIADVYRQHPTQQDPPSPAFTDYTRSATSLGRTPSSSSTIILPSRTFSATQPRASASAKA